MKREDIIRMARETDIDFRFDDGSLERFFHAAYAAGAAAEREACAKVCDELGEKGYVAEGCASAIRARGNT